MAPEVVVDWDGTVTEEDTLMLALRRFLSPEVLDPLERELDAGLALGTITHREVMEREFALMTAPLEDVAGYLVEHARIRPGFAAFARRYDPLVLSSSFHETIEPVLKRAGIAVRLRANRAVPSASGWTVDWTSDSECAVCGEACKRNALPGGPVVYVGDGYSDRCAALRADRIFARDGLARYLTERGVRFEPFSDFNDIARALESAPPDGGFAG